MYTYLSYNLCMSTIVRVLFFQILIGGQVPTVSWWRMNISRPQRPFRKGLLVSIYIHFTSTSDLLSSAESLNRGYGWDFVCDRTTHTQFNYLDFKCSFHELLLPSNKKVLLFFHHCCNIKFVQC